ncbi:MAG: TraR/DksA C4-type zinc finger protein [Betaproteobacteria bacterium]
MPDLTMDQREELETALASRHHSLVDEVRAEIERSGNSTYEDMAGQVGDTGDDSVADLLSDLGATLTERTLQQIREVDAARRRLRDGSYGICIDCGLEIPYERLRAYPTALRDIPCQTRFEKSYMQEGRPTL